MDLGLEDKAVLITGGSKGIGLACARAFAAEGARVAIASRSRENLDRAAATLQKEARPRRWSERIRSVAEGAGQPERQPREVRDDQQRHAHRSIEWP